jgi:hypothetical protein
VNLGDVLETPGLCQLVYDKLDSRSRLALRQSCRSIRQQVWQASQTPDLLYAPSQPINTVLSTRS